MLSEALNKLHEVLATLDLHDAHLSGIHVANAIEALSAHIQQSDCQSIADRLVSRNSCH